MPLAKPPSCPADMMCDVNTGTYAGSMLKATASVLGLLTYPSPRPPPLPCPYLLCALQT
jgi:hypothetical protein